MFSVCLLPPVVVDLSKGVSRKCPGAAHVRSVFWNYFPFYFSLHIAYFKLNTNKKLTMDSTND